MNEKQSQEGGDNSINIQAKALVVNNQGISVADAVVLIDDISLRNLENFALTGQVTRNGRTTKIVSRIANMLDDCGTLDSVEDPAMQHMIQSVVNDYARTEDEDLTENLLRLLSERSRIPDRNRKQLILNESLQTAASISIDQTAILSLVVLFRRPRPLNPIGLVNDLVLHLQQQIIPWIGHVKVDDIDFDHLAYSRCISIAEGSCTAASALVQSWPYLWHTGFDASVLSPKMLEFHSKGYFVPSIRDHTKVRPLPMSLSYAKEFEKINGVTNSEFSNLIMEPRLTDEQIHNEVSAFEPDWMKFLEIWDSSRIKSMELTPVGMAIGLTNARRILGESNLAGLDSWIS